MYRGARRIEVLVESMEFSKLEHNTQTTRFVLLRLQSTLTNWSYVLIYWNSAAVKNIQLIVLATKYRKI